MRNVTTETTVSTPRAKVKTHLTIGKIADFLFVIPVAIASFIGHLFWSFIANGKVICGGFLMFHAFYLSTENYFNLLSRSALTRGLEASLGNFWVAMTVLTAMLLAGTVEFIQTAGHTEGRRLQNQVKISGDRTANKSMIAAGLIATICEFVLFVSASFWDGVTAIKVVQLAIAIFGLRFGFGWFVSFQEDKLRNSTPVDLEDVKDIPQPQAPSANPPQPKAPKADIPSPKAPKGGKANAN